MMVFPAVPVSDTTVTLSRVPSHFVLAAVGLIAMIATLKMHVDAAEMKVRDQRW